MNKPIHCLRCHIPMEHAGDKTLQLGQYGIILGHLSNLVSGAMEVSIYCCPQCGKIEFFSRSQITDTLPQKKCPKCGNTHDFDYPKCPFCKHDYYSK